MLARLVSVRRARLEREALLVSAHVGVDHHAAKLLERGLTAPA